MPVALKVGMPNVHHVSGFASDSHLELWLIMAPQSGLLIGFAAGLISLANYVSSHVSGIGVGILDLSTLSFAEAEEELKSRLNPASRKRIFIGITTTTASYQSALKIASFCKGISSDLVTVFGGHHASADSENVLRYHSDVVDVVVVGEGERSLVSLLQHYPMLDLVPGIVFMRNEQLKHTPPPLPLNIQELDSIPVGFGTYGLLGTPGKFNHATYVSARGCPMKCAFCAVGRSEIRAKSFTTVSKDIEGLLALGFEKITIEDNFFAHSPKRTREICLALAEVKRLRNGEFGWDCQTRVESLASLETVLLMAKAGCEEVYIGVESLNADHLSYLAKTKYPAAYVRELVEKVVPNLLQAGIDCNINLQFGLPNESAQHHSETLALLRMIGAMASERGRIATIFPQLHVIYPGTDHFVKGVAKSQFPGNIFEAFTKWEFSQAPVLRWLGEHFAHGTGGIPIGILEAEPLRQESFEIDINAVFNISAAIRSIDCLSGVRVFHYGKYLVSNPSLSAASVDDGSETCCRRRGVSL